MYVRSCHFSFAVDTYDVLGICMISSNSHYNPENEVFFFLLFKEQMRHRETKQLFQDLQLVSDRAGI